jgi:hypothetical protein
MPPYTVRLVSLGLLLVVLVGCGGNPPTAEVTGTVTYDGRPLKEGTIIFEAPGARPASGKIVDGKIVEVTTFKPGDGAPIGNHKVAIQSVKTSEAAAPQDPGQATPKAGYMGSTSLIPEVYGNPETSGLTATIKEGTNAVTFELKKNP